MTSSPVTPVDNENMAALIKWDDEEGDLKPTTPVRNQKASHLKSNSSLIKPKPSSRIRCADKILTQLEIQADAVIASNSNRNHSRSSMRSQLTDTAKRNAVIFGDMADRANANANMLTRNASLDESLLDNMKPTGSKPRKSVTFKDC